MSETVGPLISARGVTRVYSQGTTEVHALGGIDLDVTRGEIVALVGPSGSGKSTLLHVIGALDRPTSGEILVEGRAVGTLDRSAAARFRLERIGFVFQAYNLLPVLTVFENAEYTLMLQGMPRLERRARVMPLLEVTGLADLTHRRPHELSGGQQQRVAVVRAIAPRPALVLADEPTANLDRENSTALLDLLVSLNERDGITCIMASHDPLVTERARRVVYLVDGRVDRDSVTAADGL